MHSEALRNLSPEVASLKDAKTLYVISFLDVSCYPTNRCKFLLRKAIEHKGKIKL